MLRLVSRLPLLLLLLLAFVCVDAGSSNRSFGISSDGTSLVKDGKPHRVLSGGFHYFRAPHETWALRLATLKASGVNAVQTYLAWNWHCPNEFERCDFSGDRNISHFFRLAQEAGLDVMLRAGPYICAEWDFGGFPAWILRENASIAVRSMDPQFIRFVRDWYEIVMPILQPFLYVNGGPVIMVQVENEYGSYGSDTAYIAYLRDLFRSFLGNDVLLYSTDGNAAWYVDRSATPGVYQAVDFGPGTNATASWIAQRTNMGKISPIGPPFNDEMYTGWLPQWFDAFVPDNSIVSVVDETRDIMITSSNTSSMNLYMFFGGTNFGFMASYTVTTSYDYGAPMNETGHPTAKYMALRTFFPSIGPLGSSSSDRQNDDDAAAPPSPPPLEKYGEVQFTRHAAIFDNNVLVALASNVTVQPVGPIPLSMEQTGQSYGYIAYQLSLIDAFKEKQIVPTIENISCKPFDYAFVYIDGSFVGHLIRGKNSTIDLSSTPLVNASELLIVVENTGRISFFNNGGPHTRGLFNPIYINGVVLSSGSFTVLNLPMGSKELSRIPWSSLSIRKTAQSKIDAEHQPGIFYHGFLDIASSNKTTTRGATLLDMRGFGKGFVVVNGRNLGRYWSIAGPQYSLHCPAEFLRFGGRNEVVVFDQVGVLSGNATPVLTLSNINYNALKPSDSSRLE